MKQTEKQRGKTKREPIRLTREVLVSRIETEIKTTLDEKYKTHLRTLLLFHKGKSLREISEIQVVSKRSVQNWIHAYNENGEDGLKTKPTGRPKGRTYWENSPFEHLAEAINKNEKYWSLRLMTEWLAENEKVSIPKSTIWYRVTQIGYSHKSSRPYPYKGDPQKQEAFKKGA